MHGNNPEIQAISELFNRPVEVFVPGNGATPLNIFHAEYKTSDAPIRLSYHDRNHYNAVVDPLVPTAGLGLGLPGLQLGLADKLQVAKAVAESDKLADQMDMERALEESQNDQLQRAIKESALSVDYVSNDECRKILFASFRFCFPLVSHRGFVHFLRCTKTKQLRFLMWTQRTLSLSKLYLKAHFSRLGILSKVSHRQHQQENGGDRAGPLLSITPLGKRQM